MGDFERRLPDQVRFVPGDFAGVDPVSGDVERIADFEMTEQMKVKGKAESIKAGAEIGTGGRHT
jgi:hypothetical protein